MGDRERERESTEGMRRISVLWSGGRGMHYLENTKIKFDDQMITRRRLIRRLYFIG